MACDAATLEALAALDKNPALSERDRLICYASVCCAGFASAQVAMNAAAANGYAKLSDRDLDAALLTLVC